MCLQFRYVDGTAVPKHVNSVLKYTQSLWLECVNIFFLLLLFVTLALLSHSFNSSLGLLDLPSCEHLVLHLMMCSASFMSLSAIVGSQLERGPIFPTCELHAYSDYY
jgi:hypothetical protein